MGSGIYETCYYCGNITMFEDMSYVQGMCSDCYNKKYYNQRGD